MRLPRSSEEMKLKNFKTGYYSSGAKRSSISKVILERKYISSDTLLCRQIMETTSKRTTSKRDEREED